MPRETKKQLQERLEQLQDELSKKNAVLELYADHRNWVRPSEVRDRLGIPERDRGGQSIEEPQQSFVGARYPWEPALKVMMGMQSPAVS